MSLVFVNYPLETFTPTASGALATIIWECCQVAGHESPFVITRSSVQERFDWPQTISVDYPGLPRHPLATKALRGQRKLSGWRHLRHRAWAARVAQAIAKNGLADRPIVLINDPETAIFLRRRFPRARLLHWFQNQMPASPRVRRELASHVDVLAGVSDFTARWVAQYYGSQTVETIYNGVNPDQFTPRQTDDDGPPTVTFVGRTGIEKAPDLLLRAALIVSQQTKRFAVRLIGANHWDRFEMDSYQAELARLADELCDAGVKISRPGHVGRFALPAELRHAQVHVVPSRWDEPFGLTTLEGMASGLAIIASRTGGTPEVVGESGLLFTRDSAEELADHLLRLIENPAERRRYGQEASVRAGEFPWRRTWNRISELTAN